MAMTMAYSGQARVTGMRGGRALYQCAAARLGRAELGPVRGHTGPSLFGPVRSALAGSDRAFVGAKG